MIACDRRVTTAIVVAAAALLAHSVVSAAQQPAPTLLVFLHQSVVGVNGPTVPPVVRLLGAGGDVVAEATADTQAADGTWLAQLSQPSALTDRVLVTPGQTVEADTDGGKVSVLVPEITVRTDPASDTITGRAPGFAALYAQPHFDPDLFAGMTDPDAESFLVAADGTFEHSWAGKVDLAPGVYGDLVGSLGGHLFATQFAAPQATVYWDQPAILVRADAGMPIQLTSGPAGGGRLFRSEAYPYAASLYFVPLYNPFDPEAPAEKLWPGDTLTATAAGAPLFAEQLPHATANIDRPGRRAFGSGPPDARALVKLIVERDAPATSPFEGLADSRGSWETALGNADIGPDAAVDVMLIGKGALAHHVSGQSLTVGADLYGFRVSGVIAGRGPVMLELADAGGAMKATGSAETAFDGAFAAELFAADRSAAILTPGQRLKISPEWGPSETVTVAPVTARAELRVVEGNAPAGALVHVRAYTTPVSVFMYRPLDLAGVDLSARADENGRYRVECPAPCDVQYGVTTADTGATVSRLVWLSEPIAEADVRAASVRGYATAGDVVSVWAGAEPWDGISVPDLGIADLPGWRADFAPAFPGGFAPGTWLEVDVGGRSAGATVPALEWTADTAGDRVTGTGQPGLALLVAAIPPESDARAASVTTATVRPNGTWEATFAGFDLRGGDALELFSGTTALLLRWYEPAVRGNDRPTPTPTRAPDRAFLPRLGAP